MLLSFSITGIFLSVILLSFSAKKYKSSIYLSGFFFTLSFQGFMVYVIAYSKSIFLLSVFIINFTFLLYLIGPMFYWYIRSILTDNSRLKKSDLLHLLPSLIALITSFNYMCTPYSYKIQMATEFAGNINVLIPYYPTVLYSTFFHKAILLSRPLFVLGYVFWAAGLLIQYVVQREKLSVFSGQYHLITWLSLLIGFLFILTVCHLLVLERTFTSANPTLFYTLNLLQILSFIGFGVLLISPFFFPEILYGLPRFPKSIITSDTEKVEQDQLSGESRKKTNYFETSYLLSINQKADSCMKEFEPYLQPDFNLTQLSVQTHVPVHHLSYFFREVKKQSFTDYRNKWRIKHAKKLIREGLAEELTLEAIGKLSGFSSRNNFRTTFEKFEGISPSDFLAQKN